MMPQFFTVCDVDTCAMPGGRDTLDVETIGTISRMAATIASKAPLGLRVGKQALNEVEGLPLDEGYPIEQRYSTQLTATEDAREATRAMLE